MSRKGSILRSPGCRNLASHLQEHRRKAACRYPGKAWCSPATSSLSSRKATWLLRFLLLGSCRDYACSFVLVTYLCLSVRGIVRIAARVENDTWVWLGGREARQAVSLLRVGNPQGPEVALQSEDDNITQCFQVFSGFAKG